MLKATLAYLFVINKDKPAGFEGFVPPNTIEFTRGPVEFDVCPDSLHESVFLRIGSLKLILDTEEARQLAAALISQVDVVDNEIQDNLDEYYVALEDFEKHVQEHGEDLSKISAEEQKTRNLLGNRLNKAAAKCESFFLKAGEDSPKRV
ncbi:hypothetical protein [Singulisphaera acidiphila]|uniref:Uncharacterized protein n=1 Tax=Singulisphaera acidiphila (strain ATCC BAA-1392 / DSM 18658 / VKM B-2454 / MOB10) TaxID=886293 RepID=L0DB29_SINAD|nr:hypothetical protein [Singulisphaera acidiphila]AGA26048.1 hypothetical protein Sinac_1672 [Singulisphaera acidiphila DSM 18658]